MAEEFNTKLDEVLSEAGKKITEGSRTLINRLDVEKQKAEIRSEIGHNARDLSKAYEKLGREYFAAKENNSALPDDAAAFDLIRSKEKVIELLNEKLDRIEKE